MYEQAVVIPHLEGNLTDRLQKRLAFNVARSSADLGDQHVGSAFFCPCINKILYLACDMRDDLYGLSQIAAFSLPAQHIPVNSAGCKVGKLGEILVYEPFVMSEVKVSFRSIIGDEHLAVLKRAHGPRIDIHIRIKLLCCYFQSTLLQEPAERCGRNALAKARNDSSCYKYIFRHMLHLIPIPP